MRTERRYRWRLGYSYGLPVAGKEPIEIGAQHRRCVERLEAIEQSLPDDGHDGRGAKQLRKADQRVVGDFAALQRADKPRPHHLEDTPEHLAIVEFRQRREARPLADD